MTVKMDFRKFKSTFKNNAELDAAIDAGRGDKSKFFKPGVHELEIVSAKVKVDDKGNVVYANDPTWFTVQYEFKGVGSDKTIKSSLLIPLAGEAYTGPNGKPTMFVYQKLKEFCKALGIMDDVGQIQEVLPEYFSNLDVQVGARIKATIGYDGCHSTLLRKKADEGGLLLKLVDKEGKDILGADGQPVTGVNDEQLKMFCKSHSPELRFSGFANIVKVEASESPVVIKKASEAVASIF